MEVATILTGLFCLVSGVIVGVLWSGGQARRQALLSFQKASGEN